MSSRKYEITEDLKPKFALIYSILLSSRWHELSYFKRITTVLLIEGGCSKKLQQRLNRMGVCLSYSTRDTLLNAIGSHFMDKAVVLLKKGATLRGTGDNWDLKIKMDHMRKAIQNKISTLPIIDADEAKYQDCVKILRTYEKWIWELYDKAGLAPPEIPDIVVDVVPESNQADPGQPMAQVVFTSNDPMKDNKIVFAGDQLSRIRFSGAKDLLQGCHTPTDRLEHCSPFKPVMWHTKASLLQYCFNLLYVPESVNEKGTLKFFREKLNRKNVTPKKVVDSYEGCEEFFISVGKGYIVAAALNLFGISNMNEKPADFPDEKASDDVKKEYFNGYLEQFVRKFVIQSDYDNNSSDDFKQNYGLMIIFLTVLLLQMKDTAAEADGDRNLINQKILLVVFKALNSRSKYAVEMFTSIAQIECTLTPRLSQEFKWGFFLNWRGGKETILRMILHKKFAIE
ncbi:uncharacterized protein [Clytia hemisphaerica]|uniref:uncharacterized protein n=1 Tax=Clytia hemisphaerica TaxID=252671 RepID=UPI0034D551A2